MKNLTPKEKLDKNEVKKAQKRVVTFVFILILSAVSYAAYYYLTSGMFGYTVANAVMWIYFTLLCVFLCVYILYNRAFVLNKRTAESFPKNMDRAEIEKILEESEKRSKKTKWMVFVIVPLIFTFMIDMLNLFVFDMFR